MINFVSEEHESYIRIFVKNKTKFQNIDHGWLNKDMHESYSRVFLWAFRSLHIEIHLQSLWN